ncbi:hypothetical protein ABG067_004313 [Albugo candida]
MTAGSVPYTVPAAAYCTKSPHACREKSEVNSQSVSSCFDKVDGIDFTFRYSLSFHIVVLNAPTLWRHFDNHRIGKALNTEYDNSNSRKHPLCCTRARKSGKGF